MYRISVALLLFFLLPEYLQAQKTATWGPVFRTVRYEYRLMNPTGAVATDIDVYLPLPHESPRQEIHYLRLSERGKQRRFTDVHGQELVQYTFDRLEAGAWVDVGFVAGATVRNLRWISPDKPTTPGGPVLTHEERQRYLKSVPNYSMNAPIMQKKAAELTQGAGSDFEKLRRIHDYVIRSIRYVRDNRWDPAAVVLTRGTGSCSEYNYVLSGLCRNAGLPTRYVGGSTNGFRPLPTTDTVYHRWTEVFLTGLGWFPVDCSRDANPLRGPRSHFGRVHTDVVVWCRQAGGGEDYLGWDYRAEHRVTGKDPGLKDAHRTRWFSFQPEERVDAARTWLLNGTGSTPEPDLLECALIAWPEASRERQEHLIAALAAAGRNESLRRAATLPEAGELRKRWIRKLCASPKLAAAVLTNSRPIDRLRSWFKSNEVRLLPAGEATFCLEKRELPPKQTDARSCSSPAAAWAAMAPTVVDRLAASMDGVNGKAVAVMPVVDQTSRGLGGQETLIHVTLKALLAAELDIRLIDEDRFNDFLERNGPGKGEFWAFALAEPGRPGTTIPTRIKPDYILVPLCITERTKASPRAYLCTLEVKGLELKNYRYFRAKAQRTTR